MAYNKGSIEIARSKPVLIRSIFDEGFINNPV